MSKKRCARVDLSGDLIGYGSEAVVQTAHVGICRISSASIHTQISRILPVFRTQRDTECTGRSSSLVYIAHLQIEDEASKRWNTASSW